MKIGAVKSSAFSKGEYRIDPDLYLSDGVKVRREINNLPYEISNVGENAERVFYGNIFSRMFVNKPSHGVEYLAASDTVLSDLHTGRYISNIQAKQLSYLILQKGWILVTCSGTLGNVTYTTKEFAGKLATHDLIRIVPNNNKVNAGTLYAFLSSKYGYNQITQSQFGGVVKHINEAQMSAVEVPVFPESFQSSVDDLIQESARLREEATEKLEEAKRKVEEYCNLPFTKKFGAKANSTKISTVLKTLNTRLDPPVYINDGVDWMTHLKKETVRLGDIDIETWYPGIFKRIYVDKGLPYIKGSAVFNVNPFKSCDHLSYSRTPMLDELWLTDGLLLITCAGAVGLVKLITKEYEDKHAIGSPDIIRLISNDKLFTTEYLFAFLQIPAVYDYMQSLKYGSVIERFDIDNVKTIPIVKPTEELSVEITELIKAYKDCTYRAFNSEEKAITMVEDEIEKWNKG